MADEPTYNIDRFNGLRNKQQSRRLEPGSLTVASNIDVDDSGGIILRPGFVKSLALANVTSSFATHDERRAFIVDSGNLFLVHSDLSLQGLMSTGISTDYIHWVEIGKFVLLSTGHIIDGLNNVTSWRIQTPLQPMVSVVSGSLPAGQYQIAIAYADLSGREGGASDILTIDIPAGSGLAIVPEFLTNDRVRVYVTEPDGTELYLYTSLTAGSVTVTDVKSLSSPIEAEQIGAQPAPDVNAPIAYYESSLWVAEHDGANSIVWMSKPSWWNLFCLQEDYIQVPGRITSMVGHAEGLIIGTEDAIYVYNNGNLEEVASYGTPEGRPFDIDDQGMVHIWTNQGMCSALPFKNLTEEKVSLPPGKVVHTTVIEHNGFRKLVTLTDNLGEPDNNLL